MTNRKLTTDDARFAAELVASNPGNWTASMRGFYTDVGGCNFGCAMGMLECVEGCKIDPYVDQDLTNYIQQANDAAGHALEAVKNIWNVAADEDGLP